MDKIQAVESIQKLNAESFSLNPSSLITLFEIDVSDILFETGLLNAQGEESINSLEDVIFRFHNNVKFFPNPIVWQGNTYHPAPVNAEGFDLTSKGTLPVPKLSITVNEESVPLIAHLRNRITQLGDIIGAKVTRIRTFARYLDAVNFRSVDEQPKNFSPDPHVEFPRDVFYIDRKSTETKLFTEYELASVFDLEGIKLPGRVVYADRCSWTYRGEGCCYEYFRRRNTSVHGEAGLPLIAPAVATSNDEFIYDILGFSQQATIKDMGAWSNQINYTKGLQVYIEKGGIKYYFVAKVNNPPAGPPNLNYWIPDQCSRTLHGCKLRWLTMSNTNKPEALKDEVVSFGPERDKTSPFILPFGGFPGANKV